jgi:hypothetical protein
MDFGLIRVQAQRLGVLLDRFVPAARQRQRQAQLGDLTPLGGRLLDAPDRHGAPPSPVHDQPRSCA